MMYFIGERVHDDMMKAQFVDKVLCVYNGYML